jgi:hypothetical protein
MKLPSIRQVVEGSTQTFLRFPFVVIDAVVGTIAALILIDFEGPAQATVLFNILLATMIGIPFLTALALFAEKRKLAGAARVGLQVAGVVLLVAYAFTVPSNLTAAPMLHLIRFFVLLAAMHLLAAWVPFSARGEVNGFWHYNKTLFLRFLLAALYSHVLWAGLAIALAALQNLFGMNIPGKRYPELWVFIAGIFNTWLFLAGIPENLESLESRTDYPKGLKIFTQYILLPIILVYLVILYAYAGKIVVEWNWPKGWVSGLIFGFSATGILSLLLLHPIRELVENRWIRTVSRWFYAILIPLVIMLLLALWRRLGEYGITENRYIGIVLALWLAAIVVYFLVSKGRSIKVIPASLCVLAFLVSVGPWGMFSVSEQNQVSRLETLLTQNKILVDGKVQSSAGSIEFDAKKDISSILLYLHEMHGYAKIQGWFSETITEDSAGNQVRGKDPRAVAKLMGIEFVDQWQAPVGTVMNLVAQKNRRIDISGYQRLFGYEGGTFNDSSTGLQLRTEALGANFIAKREIPGGGVDSAIVGFRPVLEAAIKEYLQGVREPLPPEHLSAAAEAKSFRIKVYMRQVHVSRQQDSIKIHSSESDVLFAPR